MHDSAPSDNRPLSPRFRHLPPPLIIIGMHRSGTSLVAGMLTALGLYMDPEMPPPADGEPFAPPDELRRISGYGEATAFRLLNERLMAQTGAAWDRIEPFLRRRDRPAFARAAVSRLRRVATETLERDFLGGMLSGNGEAWGWKDPRNSLTLDFWLQLFPEARVLHILRDPERVVDSLERRARAWSRRAAETPVGPGARLRRAWRHPGAALRGLIRRLRGVPVPASPQSREEWLRLCDRYVHEARRFRRLGSRYLEMRYEDILARPEPAVETLARFAGLNPSAARRQQAVAFVRKPEAVPAESRPDTCPACAGP